MLYLLKGKSFNVIVICVGAGVIIALLQVRDPHDKKLCHPSDKMT